jgi:hypothetical protein
LSQAGLKVRGALIDRVVMHYQPVSTRLVRSPRDLTESEQKAYFNWFITVISQRVEQLAKLVCSTSGFSNWEPNKRPDSLPVVHQWLCVIVKSPELLRAEDRDVQKKLDILAYEWPYRESPSDPVVITSAAFDIGIYLGEVFREKHANVDWWLCKTKLDGLLRGDYGQPVLINFGARQQLNPFQLVKGIVSSILNGYPIRALDELYANWSNYIPADDRR